LDYNPPNTRERIEARRRARRTGRATRPAFRPPEIKVDWKSWRNLPRPQLPKPMLATLRQQARQQPRSEGGSQVHPGTRRAVAGWLRSGRLVSLLLFIAAMSGLFYLFLSPRFHIHDVALTGNTALKREAVLELAGIQGLPIWFVDTEYIAGRLLQSAYVERATVALDLPNQAMIRIVERQPEVRWQAGGIQYLVDGSGKVLEAAQSPGDADTLVINDTSSPGFQPNDQIDVDALELSLILALRLPTELGLTPDEIGWDYGLGVFVRTSSGQTIVFGRTDNLERKLMVLDQLRKEQIPFTYLDLRPANPFLHAN
jgi:cell division protein FtsQ